MMETFLQIWGGAGYFLAKVLLVRADFAENGRNLRLAGWLAYLLGFPAWAAVLAGRQNWIAAAMETAGVPSIILGIVTAWKQINPPKAVDRCIRLFIGVMITLGVSYSIYTFHGIKTFSQLLEITITVVYLTSVYLLAKRNPFAWLMFAAGHSGMGLLMYMQGKMILSAQQAVSLIPAITGFIKGMEKIKSPRRAGTFTP